MKKTLLSALSAGLVASAAQADIIPVTSNITEDTTWTADNEYILTDIIYVLNDAMLTIEPGTIIRGEPSTGIGNFDPGALVVTTSGKINAQGTATNPIVFTTAALDSDQNGQVDGYDFFVDDNGTPDNSDDDADRVTATQVVVEGGVLQNGPFLDADPLGSPLPPAIYVDATETGAIATFTDADGDTVPNEYRQLWGGVIILGEAPMNADVTDAGGLGRQFIEGLPSDPTLSGFGGFNPNDNSGVFSYVSIRHGGAVIGSGNEINGLTMGGVGFGTKIDYVDVYCNADDGYEWFGGTVNTKYLASIFNNDDAFDIDSGFTGLGQFWFALMNNDGENGDKGAEHDGETGDGNDSTLEIDFSIPKTYAVVYNATFIGNPTKKTEPFRLRDNWGGEYHNSIFTQFGFDGADSGIEIEADGEGRFSDGEIIFSGNTFFAIDESVTPADYAKTATGGALDTALAGLFSATASAEGFNLLKDPEFPSMNRRVENGVNPVPGERQEAAANNGSGGTFGSAEPATFFKDVSYKGAFDTTPSATLWTTGWTAISLRGIIVDRGDGVDL